MNASYRVLKNKKAYEAKDEEASVYSNLKRSQTPPEFVDDKMYADVRVQNNEERKDAYS